MAHASMIKLANCKYRVCLEYGFDENGKRIRKYKTFVSKKEAEVALSRHNIEMEDGTAVVPQEITLKEWLDYWMKNMYEPRSAETSIYGYKNMIDSYIIPNLGNIKLQRLKSMHIQKYYTMLMEKKGLSPNTVIKHNDLLNSALKAAVKQEYLLRNPIDGVERPKKIKHEARFYTPEELQALLKLVQGDRLEVPVKLGAYLGLRREEICGLKWVDIDLDNHVIHINRAMTQAGSKVVVKETKTYASTRKLYLPESLAEVLRIEKNRQKENCLKCGEAWQGISDFVVVWEDGKPYRPNYISELFTKFLKKHGMPKIVLHELRHTFASISNEAGVQDFNIGKALGHANVSTTKKIYTHLFDDQHTTAINAVANLVDKMNVK